MSDDVKPVDRPPETTRSRKQWMRGGPLWFRVQCLMCKPNPAWSAVRRNRVVILRGPLKLAVATRNEWIRMARGLPLL